MTYRLRILGIVIAELEIIRDESLGTDPVRPEVSEESEPTHTGGGGHNFERDLYAPDPADVDSRHFGFHR